MNKQEFIAILEPAAHYFKEQWPENPKAEGYPKWAMQYFEQLGVADKATLERAIKHFMQSRRPHPGQLPTCDEIMRQVQHAWHQKHKSEAVPAVLRRRGKVYCAACQDLETICYLRPMEIYNGDFAEFTGRCGHCRKSRANTPFIKIQGDDVLIDNGRYEMQDYEGRSIPVWNPDFSMWTKIRGAAPPRKRSHFDAKAPVSLDNSKNIVGHLKKNKVA